MASKRENPWIRRKVTFEEIEITTFDDILEEKWRKYLRPFEMGGSGEVEIEDFLGILRTQRFRTGLDKETLLMLEHKLMDQDRLTVNYQEFANIMGKRRNSSYRQAVDEQASSTQPPTELLREEIRRTCFQKMVRRIAKEFITDEDDRYFYSDHYSCCPPPLFIPVITLLEIGSFVYYSMESGRINFNGPVPVNSIFIYRPDRRIEVWRFIMYMFLHAGWVHLCFNMLVQIVVGIPLEMVHGSLRLIAVYLSGVLAGSLGTSVFDMEVYLVGASGGVYALLAAHLANILLNYSRMELRMLKLISIIVVASADVGFAIWNRYSVSKQSIAPVGYSAHLLGALAGLSIGLVVLKHFEQKLHEQYTWWIALGVYVTCAVFAIFWNIFYY